MFLAQGHNTVTLMRLEPANPRFHDKHSTTEPLRSLFTLVMKENLLVHLYEGQGELHSVAMSEFPNQRTRN